MSKINKLGKSTFVIAILSFLLVAVLAFGGTYAYFTDKAATTSGSITMGHLYFDDASLTANVTANNNVKLVPNQPLFEGGAKIDVMSNIAYYARITLQIGTVDTQTVNGVNHDECECTEKSTKLLLTEGALTGGWVADATNPNVWYLTTATLPDADGKTELALPVSVKVNPVIGNGGSQHFMDATATVNLTFEVIQADYIAVDTEKTPAEIAVAIASAFDNAK